jgi:hypothetical protein
LPLFSGSSDIGLASVRRLFPLDLGLRRCPSQRPIIGCTAELERQAGDDEGREEDRQETLSRASEGDGLALGDVEGLTSAGVSTIANLQGVTSRFDWYLGRVVHFDRSGTLTVNHDVVRATSDLDSDCFMRQPQRCGHC